MRNIARYLAFIVGAILLSVTGCHTVTGPTVNNALSGPNSLALHYDSLYVVKFGNVLMNNDYYNYSDGHGSQEERDTSIISGWPYESNGRFVPKIDTLTISNGL